MITDIFLLFVVLSMTTEAFKISKRLQISPIIRNGSPTLRDDDIFDDAKFQTSSLGTPQTTRPTDNKDPPVVSGVDGYMESDFKKMNKDPSGSKYTVPSIVVQSE